MDEPTTTPRLAPTESVTKRFKLIWRVLLISNLALGAYMFARARKKDSGAVNSKVVQKVEKTKVAEEVEDSKASVEVPSAPTTSNATTNFEDEFLSPPVFMPMKIQDPIPEEQQLELFQWILEEKRKLKPKDRMGKKQIDEDKAILKHYIRAKSIPSL